MQRIAQCESSGRHFTKEGQVLRGRQNRQDTGLFQINAGVWAKQAEALGYDIHTPEGNTQMARYIFENYGSEPWRSSAKCWGDGKARAPQRGRQPPVVRGKRSRGKLVKNQ